jgi:hypothetical protein
MGKSKNLSGSNSIKLLLEVGLCYKILVCAPTTKAVGSIDVTKLEPTALVVGLQKKEAAPTFETASFFQTGEFLGY